MQQLIRLQAQPPRLRWQQLQMGNPVFEMRGTALGNRWAREMKKGDLAEKYAQCNGDKAEQQRFRQAWVLDCWNECAREKTETTELTNSSKQVGACLSAPEEYW